MDFTLPTIAPGANARRVVTRRNKNVISNIAVHPNCTKVSIEAEGFEAEGVITVHLFDINILKSNAVVKEYDLRNPTGVTPAGNAAALSPVAPKG